MKTSSAKAIYLVNSGIEYSKTKEYPAKSFNLFGIRIQNATIEEATSHVLSCIKTQSICNIAFVNADCMNKTWKDTHYSTVLNGFRKVYADGSGIRLAAAFKGIDLRDNVNGTDLFPRLCLAMAAQNSRLFLLGGKPGVAEACGNAMQKRYQGLNIAGWQHGYFQESETPEIILKINQSQADVLLVAFGAPIQESWIAEYHHQLSPNVRIGVGGLFDFYSGRISRAPLWLRNIGQEWIWRLLQEPSRMWRRYILGNPLFIARVFLERFIF